LRKGVFVGFFDVRKRFPREFCEYFIAQTEFRRADESDSDEDRA
jgi:hypothetical protein